MSRKVSTSHVRSVYVAGQHEDVMDDSLSEQEFDEWFSVVTRVAAPSEDLVVEVAKILAHEPTEWGLWEYPYTDYDREGYFQEAREIIKLVQGA